jgi:hypothetical protein
MAPDDLTSPPEAATLPKTPISIRLVGELESEVAKRRYHGESPASVIRRDLGRYYAACRESLKRLRFDIHEADILVNALRSTELTAATARFLWAEVDEYLRGREASLSEIERDHAPHLLDQLRKISPADAVAILDAVEIFWDYEANVGDSAEAMEASGLTRDLPDPDPDR